MRTAFNVKDIKDVLKSIYSQPKTEPSIDHYLYWIIFHNVDSSIEVASIVKCIKRGIYPDIKLSITDIICGLEVNHVDNDQIIYILKQIDKN